MAQVSLVDLWKTYNEKVGPVVRNLSLDIKSGELISLLGPSGCGKTTVLRMIAGLEYPDAGDVLIDGQSIIGLDPKDRDIALVFQQYALYPHMTVEENLRYPLKILKLSSEEQARRVQEVAAMLKLDSMLNRKPGALSGGEQQRVALGRAIVRRPRVFLMDEPLSNLDAILRVQMRTYLKAMQRETGVTTVVVTHDQSEAMSMSDSIAVMNLGVIQQIGTPDYIYQHPANTFVAGFIGDPPMNLMPAERIAEGVRIGGNWTLPAPADLPPGEVALGARPEAIRISLKPRDGWHPVEVYLSEPQGSETIVNVHVADEIVRIRAEPDIRPAPNEIVYLNVERSALRYFDSTTGNAVI